MAAEKHLLLVLEIFELDCLSKARSRHIVTSSTEARHLLIYTKALSGTLFYSSFGENHQKQKLVNQRVATTGWKNCQYIHAKGQLFQASNLLGLQKSVCIQIFITENFRQIIIITHFQSFCIYFQLESLLLALQSLLGGPCKHNIYPEVVNYNISHFNHPPLGPPFALFLGVHVTRENQGLCYSAVWK
jgi:hypothetical protein